MPRKPLIQEMTREMNAVAGAFRNTAHALNRLDTSLRTFIRALRLSQIRDLYRLHAKAH
jgi:ABC-type transporter Mla subunit MlaD